MFTIALKKNPKPDSSGHTQREQRWDPNPRSVLPQSPLQRAALPAPWIPKGETNHTVQPARVREGWGRVLKAEHPDLPPPLPLPSGSNIHPQKHAPPHKPIPAHQPHPCSPTQTFKGTRGPHFTVCLALSSQTENRHEMHCASAGYTAGESPTAWGLVLGSVGFRQGPEAELSSRDTATESQAHPKLESSTLGT